MSKNIKEIGKELLGKSLNSFHRKTGLTQLEKNNEMQDGILDGILSQVDDAYIEKTEQSNVIHLEGSGDGVVVLDSIEGNTMVNIIKQNDYRIDNSVIYRQENSIRIKRNSSSSIHFAYLNINNMWKENTIYTMVYIVEKNTFTKQLELNNNTGAQFDPFLDNGFKNFIINGTGVFIDKLTTKPKSEWNSTPMLYCTLPDYDETNLDQYIDFKMIVLEGDWTNKEIPPYFEGIKSSFEEKVNDEGKYEIEILSHKGRPNELKNSFNELQASPREYMSISITDIAKKYLGKRVVVSGKVKSIGKNGDVRIYSLGKYSVGFSTLFNCNTSNYINFVCEGRFTYEPNGANREACNLSFYGVYDSGIFPCVKDIKIEILDDNDNILATEWCPNYKDDEIHWKNHKKSNKIKLLLNAPLKKITSNIKDRLCIKDGKLVVERKCKQVKFDGTIGIHAHRYDENNQIQIIIVYSSPIISDKKNNSAYTINSTLPCITQPAYGMRTVPNFSGYVDSSAKFVGAIPNKTGRSFTNKDAENYFKENPMDVVYELEEPYYEEVLNEYGEPIILEGYKNGTFYIDSTIIPTTTVSYTPKMESLNTLKKISNNNTLLSNDVNDTIIPYMMEVDLMIMEKEMALPSQINNRKMEELDMTSMQKRTQDMLERLIKGKTLTEQECKTRVTTYLNAGKITDEQAEELMLVISEIYN